MRTSKLIFLALALVAASAWAGDAPYLGKWKLNPAKSDFGETTMTYEEMADGQMKMIADGQSFNFKADGKDYPTPWGDFMAWKTINSTTWQSTYRSNGKVTFTSTMTLAPDGKTLKVESTNIRANGDTSHDSVVYERASGTSGIAGKWKTRKVNVGSPGTVILAANGVDGVTLNSVEDQASCAAKFDGKDHPANGPTWPAGWTCSISRSGDSGIGFTWKKDGRLMYQQTLTASGDGKVLTNMSVAPAASETAKIVYDRL